MSGVLHRTLGKENPRARVGLLRGMYSKVAGEEKAERGLWAHGSPQAWYQHSKSSGFSLRSWWVRSLPAHIGRELVFYLFLFYVLHLFFRVGMNEQQQLEFSGLAIYFGKKLSYVGKDMVFLLGFFVKQIVARWWTTWEAVPLPDPVNLICHSLVEKTPRGKQWASRINRYCLLSYVLCLRRISRALQRMFPSDQSLTDCGLVQAKELEFLRSEGELGRVWWLPLSWCMTLIKKTKEEKKVIESEQKILVGGILKYHAQLERVDGFDHVIFPPVYNQVVTFAIYAYFSLSLISEQVEKGDILDHFPGLLILKFIFAFGWLEVAEAIKNPWGPDPDDFQVCDLVERHIWALGKGLEQWQGPPEEEEEEKDVEKEEEEQEEEKEGVKLNCQTGASKYTK